MHRASITDRSETTIFSTRFQAPESSDTLHAMCRSGIYSPTMVSISDWDLPPSDRRHLPDRQRSLPGCSPHSCVGIPEPLEIWAVSNLPRSEEHTSELQSHHDLVCRLLLEK